MTGGPAVCAAPAGSRSEKILKSSVDPCRFIRQVKEFKWLDLQRNFRKDPCRFMRQVNEFSWLCNQPKKLIHLPDKPAGVLRSEAGGAF